MSRRTWRLPVKKPSARLRRCSRFWTEDDVIAGAKRHGIRRALYFYAKDLSRVFRVAEALEYGMVGVNTGLISTAGSTLRRRKLSASGREGSKYGIEEFMESNMSASAASPDAAPALISAGRHCPAGLSTPAICLSGGKIVAAPGNAFKTLQC